MALQIEGDAIFFAGIPDRPETLDQQFQTDLTHVGNIVAAKLVGSGGNRKKWLQQWAGEPTKPGSATLRSCNLPRKCASRTQLNKSLVACCWISLPTSSGTK